jgi:DNA polymerase-3 subunit epsilon
MGRCLSPCLGDLDPNLYRRRLDEALRLFFGGEGAGRRLVEHVRREMRAAAAQQRYERASALRRRARRLEVIIGRLDGVLEATHARPRLLVARHPTGPSADAFWVVGGRLVDWGAMPVDAEELADRTEAALRRGGRVGELGAHLPPAEIDEVRILGTYLASHPDVTQITLDPAPDRAALVTALAA